MPYAIVRRNWRTWEKERYWENHEKRKAHEDHDGDGYVRPRREHGMVMKMGRRGDD
jgi:hypothetical protein